MALFDRPRMSMPISAAVQAAPAASTTYYISNVQGAPGINSGVGRIYMPMTSVIQIVQLNVLCGTPGSAETGSVYLRVNSATDYLISSNIKWNATLGGVANFPPLVPDELDPSNWWEIKIVTPAWLTPPLTVLYWGAVICASDI